MVLLEEYLTVERDAPGIDALWVGRRQAAGRPSRYPEQDPRRRCTVVPMGRLRDEPRLGNYVTNTGPTWGIT
jgi:hypothetical protein